VPLTTLSNHHDYWKDLVISPKTRDNTVYAGNGSDRLIGTGGGDALFGQAGDDFLFYKGNAETSDVNTDVTLSGGAGDDRIYIDVSHGYEGNGEMIGGKGQDTLVFESGGEPWTTRELFGVTMLVNTDTGQTIGFKGFEDIWLT
jgi:Ca2+-binding RTX toxin-like protein